MTPLAIAIIAYVGGALSMLMAIAFGRAARDPEIIVVVRGESAPSRWSVN